MAKGAPRHGGYYGLQPPAFGPGCLLTLVIALLLLLTPHLAWRLTPIRPIAAVVVDRTVPHENWREHAALHWWLNHRRAYRVARGAPRGTPWEATTDYLGYDPMRGRSARIDSAALDGARLLYIADAYGIYAGDYTDPTRPGLERSRVIAGGISPDEARAIERFRQRGGHVVAEFNTLEAPTWGTPASEILGRVTGARYDGWLGRWYQDLGSAAEIPRWMRERWRRRFGAAWAFSGEGIVLFTEGGDRIAVIERQHFTARYPITIDIDRPDDPLVARAASGRPYWYWFAGVTALEQSVVLASYQMHVDSVAQSVLRREGFTTRFPAIIRRRDPPLGAYLAGDFADVGERLPMFQQTRFLDGAQRRAARMARRGASSDVFWNLVSPVWDAMIAQARGQPASPR